MNHQSTEVSWVRKWAGPAVAIFPQTLYRILTESCKFLTEKIMGAQHLTFFSKISLK